MTLQRTLAAAAAMAGLLLAGCGKSDLQNKLEQAADSLKKANETLTKNAQKGQNGGESGGEHKPVAAVDYHRLQAFLPQVSGWTMGKPEGATMQMSEWNYSSANAEYTNGDGRITVTIFDYAYIESLMQVYKMKFSFENEDGYTKSVELNGFPGWETWQKNDKSANCTALVGDRFVVAIEGHGLSDASVVRNVLSSIDLKGIAALK